MQAHCPSLASLGKHQIVLQMHAAPAAAAADRPAKNAMFRVLPEAWPCTSTADLPLILISAAPASRVDKQVDNAIVETPAPASASTAGTIGSQNSTWVVVDQPEASEGDLRKETLLPESAGIPADVEAVIATLAESQPFTEPFVAPKETTGVRRRSAVRVSSRKDSAWDSLKTSGMILGC